MVWERYPLYVLIGTLAARAIAHNNNTDACPETIEEIDAAYDLVCTEPPVLMAIDVIMAVVLIFLSGLFSGLNLGLMSFTDEDLRVVIEGSSDAKEIANAQKIRPLRKNGNLLLCTLLLGNTLVNAYLAILLDAISTTIFGPGIIGVVATTFFIVVFGEIIPQSVCSRHGLLVGAMAVPIVWMFVIICAPVAFPIAKLLDYVLGREISAPLNREMLLSLININLENAAADAEKAEGKGENGLTKEDGKLLRGALTFKDRCVGDIMTKVETCYFLAEDTVLDHETIKAILSHGHTRVPIVKAGMLNAKAKDVVAVMFCKDLLGIGFERKTKLSDVLESFDAYKRVARVPRSMKLNQAMEFCKQCRQHLLVVVDDPAKPAPPPLPPAPVVGLATMEDFIEELIQDEIVDETDAWFYDRSAEEASAPETSVGGEKSGSPKRSVTNTKKTVVKSSHFDATAHLRKLANDVPTAEVKLNA